MNIIIDTTCLTKGGGQKVGWNFVNYILENPLKDNSFSFFCAKDSEIHKCLIQKNAKNVYASPNNTWKRIFWQLTQAPHVLRMIKPDVIYSVFGSCIYPKKYCQVCGEAASNLFFPEIDFWCELPKWKKIFKKWKDLYRVSMLKRANGVIFENESMRNRCAELYPDIFKRSCFIKPAINNNQKIPDNKALSSLNVNHSVLMLCSWQPNKNYSIMPEVIRILKDSNFPIRFTFSVSQDATNQEAIKFRKKTIDYSVEDSIDYLGTIPPEKIPETYEKTDVVLLLSKLESFSNNIIEAWKYKKPLIISDMEWSHSIVKDAGYYVDRNDANQIADAIRILCSDFPTREKIIKNGTRVLNSYPDISQHVQIVFSFLQKTVHDQEK